MIVRCIANILLFLLYVSVVSILVGIGFEYFTDVSDKMAWVLQIIVALLILVITLTFRKYFYISCGECKKTVHISSDETKTSYTKSTKTSAPNKKKAKASAHAGQEEKSDFEIFIDKEIQ